MAVAHLSALGHRRIAHIAGPQEMSTGLSRYRGFVTAMESGGLQVDSDLIVFAKAFTVAEGVRCSRLLLERGAGGASTGIGTRTGCTALAAGNDMLPVACSGALDDAGQIYPDPIPKRTSSALRFPNPLPPPLPTTPTPQHP